MKKAFAAFIAVLLLAPAYASAQVPDNIVLLDNFGTYSKGDSMFIYGSVGKPDSDSHLILKVTNPRGDICQIQQLLPLQDGSFVTGKIPLRGNFCGIAGEYDVHVFYGEDKNSAVFTISSSDAPVLTNSQYAAAGLEYVGKVIDEVAPASNATSLKAQLTSATGNLDAILSVYRSAIGGTLSAKVMYEVDATFRPAVDSFLDAADDLVASGKITAAKRTSLADDVISSVFYYQIGDKKRALDILYGAYGELTQADPTTDAPRPVPYEELEDALLNLMRKTGSVMNRDVQEEIALIFSRGGGPLYAEDLGILLDMLTKTRFLDVILLKDDPLYSALKSEWGTERLSLVGKDTMEKLIDEYDDVAQMYNAAVLLRGLDSVERFINTPDGTAETNLVNLLEPEWQSLNSTLLSSTSAESILNKKSEIESMKKVSQIAERISKAVDLSQNAGIGAELSGQWATMLTDVGNASSLDQILSIITVFDTTITELREKRNPISIMIFEYKRMKEQAERQADYTNLARINEAIKILEAAARLSESDAANSRVDRAELLLTWASEQAPTIQASLDSYTKTQFKDRAGKILQRAKSLEVLVDRALDSHRFHVGFVGFTESILERVLRIQNLVVSERLFEADVALDGLYDEWQKVLKAYADDPDTSVAYSLQELKRIEYRKVSGLIDTAVTKYSNSGFDTHRPEYDRMRSSVELSLGLGNFAAADEKLREMLQFVSKNLDSSHQSIIYDVDYDVQAGRWSASGYIDKDNDRRVELLLNMYDLDGGQLNSLEFVDTKTGKFSTFWNEKVEPGMYVTVLTWQGATSTKITYVEDPKKYDSSEDDPQVAKAAKMYEKIKVFIQKFGGAQYTIHQAKFSDVMGDIEKSLSEGKHREASAGTVQLQLLAERYLPQRERVTVIDVSYQDGAIRITGAVQKMVEFSEDIFVDVYNHEGKSVKSIAVKDSPTGYLDERVNSVLAPGLYVAQMHYHEFTVSDFFTVN